MVMPTSVVDTKYAFCARVENPLASAAPSTLVPTYKIVAVKKHPSADQSVFTDGHHESSRFH